MDLEYRNLLAPNGPPLFPSDFRSPRLPRPAPGEFLQRSPDSVKMEQTPPVTGKRRGGSRKACNECKQQKVSHSCSLPSSPRSLLAVKIELELEFNWIPHYHLVPAPVMFNPADAL